MKRNFAPAAHEEKALCVVVARVKSPCTFKVLPDEKFIFEVLEPKETELHSAVEEFIVTDNT